MQHAKDWLVLLLFMAIGIAGTAAQPDPSDATPGANFGVNRCGAYSVFVASAVLGHPLPLSRCVEAVPVRRAGNSMAELRLGFQSLGFDVDAFALRAGDAAGLTGAWVLWVPPGVEIRTQSGERCVPGHFVVLHKRKDASWILLDYPASARAIEPDIWLASVCSEFGIDEVPALRIRGEPNSESFLPAKGESPELPLPGVDQRAEGGGSNSPEGDGLVPMTESTTTDLVFADVSEPMVQTVLVFGTRRQGEQLEGVVFLWNGLDIPLELADVRTTCGCTAGVLEQSILQPGQGTQLSVSLSLVGAVGQVRQSVSLVARGGSMTIPVFIECVAGSERQWTVEPRSASFGSVRRSEAAPPRQKRVIVRAGFPDTAARLERAECRGEYLSAEIIHEESSPAEGIYAVLVSFAPHSLFPGYFAGEVQLFRSDGSRAEVTIPVTARIE